MVQLKQPCDIIALLSFFCVCVFLYFLQYDRQVFQSFISSLFLSFLLKTNFIFHKNHFFGDFLQKLGEGKKSIVLALSLCKSRQILGYICRPIKGSQLTPHIQVRLTFLPCTIHIFLFKLISCLQSVVCEYIPLFYGLFFHYV